MSKDREVIKNIGLSMLYKPLSVIISLMLIPLTINYLGNTSYGLWAVILSIISWIDFFDIGIGNGLRNHLARELALKNYKRAREYIATAYIVISGISFTLLIIFSSLFCFVNWQNVFNTKIYTNNELLITMFINLLFICLNFILKLVTTIYYSLQKSAVMGIMQIVNQILIFSGIYYLFEISFSRELIGVSLVYGLSGLSVNIMFSIILFLKNKYICPSLSDYKKENIKNLTDLGMKFFFIQIAAMIIFTTNNLIITKLFGPKEVTPYNITFKVFSMIVMLHGIVITPLWSAITKAWAEKDIKWLREVRKKLNLIEGIIVVGTLIVIIIFPYLIKYWLKTDVFISPLLMYLFGIYVILTTHCNNHAYFFNGIGDINFQLGVAIVQSVINIPLAVYFGKYLNMGIEGVILGTNITMLIAAILFPYKLKEILNKSKIDSVNLK